MITGKTPDGMLYAVKRSGSAAAYCSLSIRCGTRDEEGYHSGIAHFIEHTIFKGTAKRSASSINSCLDRLGGELNAFTTKEEIVLHATVLKEDARKAAGLLWELATCPTFPEKEIEKEKSVVIEEINAYKDSPADDVYDKFEELLFQDSPLGRPILGTVASVKKITSEEMIRFARENFTPDRMAMTIVADLDEKKMESYICSLTRP
ncbi:MAG: insulinase family protein [Bacteroidales bacterium]|nr:insulinase family protein [Bacteroidales bacterium]